MYINISFNVVVKFKEYNSNPVEKFDVNIILLEEDTTIFSKHSSTNEFKTLVRQ